VHEAGPAEGDAVPARFEGDGLESEAADPRNAGQFLRGVGIMQSVNTVTLLSGRAVLG